MLGPEAVKAAHEFAVNSFPVHLKPSRPTNMPAAQAAEAAAAARAATAGLAWSGGSGGASATAGGRTDGPAPPSDEELLESARRHAALQATFSPQTLLEICAGNPSSHACKADAAPPSDEQLLEFIRPHAALQVSFSLNLAPLIRQQILICGCINDICPCDVKRLLAGSSVWHRADDVPEPM